MLSRGNDVNGKPGPEECTGRFATRLELETHVHRLNDTTSLTRKQIATDCDISVGTVQSIIKKPIIFSQPDDGFSQLKRKMLLGKW